MVRGIRVRFSLLGRAKVTLSTGASDVSVVVIVSEISSLFDFRMLTFSTERNQYSTNRVRRIIIIIIIIIRIKIYRVRTYFGSNISETVRDIRVRFLLLGRAKVTLSTSASDVSVVVIVSEISSLFDFRMLTFSTERNQYSTNRVRRIIIIIIIIIIRIKKYRVRTCFGSNIS